MKIWKYRIHVEGNVVNGVLAMRRVNTVDVEMPEKCWLLHIGVQNGDIHVWAAVDTESPPRQWTFLVLATGQDLPDVDRTRYMGTVDLRGYVAHVFVRLQ